MMPPAVRLSAVIQRRISTHTQYDQYGNVRKTITPNGVDNIGNVSQVEYSPEYACAYPTKTISPAPSADGINGTTATSEATMTYDFATGLPLTVTDEYNQTIKTEYDAYLRPKKVSGVSPFVIPITETFYDDVNLSWVKVRKQIDEQNWDEATTFSDSLGRTTKTQAKDSQGDVVTATEYDNLGRVARTSNPYRVNASGYPIDCPPNNPTQCIYWSKPRYDELNRVVETFAPAKEGEPQVSLGITEFGISTVQDYVGTYTTATDASGRKARSITNALGQLVRIDEPTGTNNDLGSIGSPNQPTYYKYNAYDKITHVIQGKAGEATIQHRYFLYDYLGRLIRVKQPEQEVNLALSTTQAVDGNSQWTSAMEYDIVGNLIKTTDAENKHITSTYDKVNRVIKREYSDPDTPTVFYHYDGTGLAAVPAYSKGKLTKVSSTISATQYTSFDSSKRTLKSEQITDGITYESKYKYNLSGALLEQTYPSGKVVRNFLESDGDLAKVVRNGKVYASDFSFNVTGGVKSIKLGNGRFETAEFNSRQQVTQIGLGSTATSNDLWKVNYSYGELKANGIDVDTAKNAGNIAKQVITLPNATFTQTYRYDSVDRITEAKEVTTNNAITWQQNWSYDRFGNRTSFNSSGVGLATINTTPIINPNTNRFTNTDFQYDKTGNITKDSSNGVVREFIFNGDNKQVHVKDASGAPIGTYYYDGEGKRVKKTTANETTIFVYDGSGTLVAEYSTATPTANPTVSYTTTDHLGSPRVITDKNGNVTSRRDFMPFGEELSADNIYRTSANKYGSTTDNIRKRFTGYEKDQETQLDFAEARYYDNKHGRFTAVDPLLASGKSSDPQSFNRYTYCLNTPITMVDRNGLYPVYFYHDPLTNQTHYSVRKQKGYERYKGGKETFISDAENETKGRIVTVTRNTIDIGRFVGPAVDRIERIKGSDELSPSQIALIRAIADKTQVQGKIVTYALGGAIVIGTGTGFFLYATGAGTGFLINLGIVGNEVIKRNPNVIQKVVEFANVPIQKGLEINIGGVGEQVAAKAGNTVVNINNLVASTSKTGAEIPNLIVGNADRIGTLLQQSQYAGQRVSLITANNFTAVNFNWTQFSQQAFNVLIEGGKVQINTHGVSIQTINNVILPALRNAGFTNVGSFQTFIYATR
jgi:RHS repeat-associated protein